MKCGIDGCKLFVCCGSHREFEHKKYHGGEK